MREMQENDRVTVILNRGCSGETTESFQGYVYLYLKMLEIYGISKLSMDR